MDGIWSSLRKSTLCRQVQRNVEIRGTPSWGTLNRLRRSASASSCAPPSLPSPPPYLVPASRRTGRPARSSRPPIGRPDRQSDRRLDVRARQSDRRLDIRARHPDRRLDVEGEAERRLDVEGEAERRLDLGEDHAERRLDVAGQAQRGLVELDRRASHSIGGVPIPDLEEAPVTRLGYRRLLVLPIVSETSAAATVRGSLDEVRQQRMSVPAVAGHGWQSRRVRRLSASASALRRPRRPGGRRRGDSSPSQETRRRNPSGGPLRSCFRSPRSRRSSASQSAGITASTPAPAFVVAGALVLPPLLVVALVVALHIPLAIRDRYPWYIQTFNIANFTLSGLAAWLAVDADRPGRRSPLRALRRGCSRRLRHRQPSPARRHAAPRPWAQHPRDRALLSLQPRRSSS